MSKTEKSLKRQIAEIIEPCGYSSRPEDYGLKTEHELLEKTLVGGVRGVAMEKATAILKLIERS